MQVFSLNTTTLGTVTNSQGNFELSIPNGRYELVVSSIGFDTYNETINTDKVAEFITIRLKVKTQVMQDCHRGAVEKDGWEKWGKFFLENFIGTSANAQNCRIKNIDVIHFRNSKKKNELTAIADEPLIIENKALGYTLRYQLESFVFDFRNHYLVYTGYPFFQPMKGNAGKQKRWEKENEAYYGSMMHFMRAVSRDKILKKISK